MKPEQSAIIAVIRQKMLRPTKSVQYSYATSDNANRFHKPNGCYTVELIEHEPCRQPPIALAAFDTRQAALDFAELLSEPWDTYTLS